MILHKIDSNSTWVNPTKNRTEGEIISAGKRALTKIRLCSLNPKHQILDNEASEKYKEAIRESGINYQIVPSDEHRRNTLRRRYSSGRITLLPSSAAPPIISRYTCGAKSYHRQRDNCYCYVNQMRIRPYPLMLTSTGSMTIPPPPFVPIGTESLIHEKPNWQKTWSKHNVKGWVLGISTNHYRYWPLWVKKTGR